MPRSAAMDKPMIPVEPQDTRRVQLLIPMRTILVVAAAIGVMAAFVSIGETFLVVFVLYVWGGPGVHLFAFVMVIGVLVGTYSSIYIASPLLLMLGEGTRSSAKTLERRPGTGQPETARA